MDSKIAVRGETTGDIGAIAEVTTAAFETLAISNHTEQFIIEALGFISFRLPTDKK